MNENLLHYIWQYCQFNVLNLKTTLNLPVIIHNVGQQNANAWPDFKRASIMVDDIEWHGDVEFHIKASDWCKHNHHLDKKYNSVILHVVWECDTEIINYKKEKIPCLELKSRVNKSLLNRYFF